MPSAFIGGDNTEQSDLRSSDSASLRYLRIKVENSVGRISDRKPRGRVKLTNAVTVSNNLEVKGIIGLMVSRP